jgi:glutamate N-acetyltransferase/amino-acid N-acetyltransferase
VSTSMLFKTALFGQDPNWGRIAACVGASGVMIDPDKLDIYLGKTRVLKDGVGSLKDKDVLDKLFKNRDLDVTIDLKSGGKEYSMMTCDISLDYIKINASYTS